MIDHHRADPPPGCFATLSMTRVLLLTILAAVQTLVAAEPDYSAWDVLLAKHYSLGRGMNYRALKEKDAAALGSLRDRLGRVDVTSLTRDQQLAYWINLYNVNVVGIVVDRYPVKSIRDLSTDPIRRLNVFEKKLVPFGVRKISLDEIEHQKLRPGFRDPRIHFAINCAARSCPPMPQRALRGASVQQALDQAARFFLNSPDAVRIKRKGDLTVVHTTRIMDWFAKDFEPSGGVVGFLRLHLAPRRARELTGKIRLEYDDYDWALNDWRPR